MEKHFFEEADIADVDEEAIQLVDAVEEVVQELISHTRESSVVLYLSSHDVASWNLYSADAFCNQDLFYLKVISDC